MKTVEQRFLEKVEPIPAAGCWIWMASCFRDGYGQFKMGGKNQLAHRIAYRLFRGEIPSGICVCHTCDVPSCVNPAHLFLGTLSDNTMDAVNKGRMAPPRGATHYRARFTDADIAYIKVELSKQIRGTQRGLTREFNVTKHAIYAIQRGITWKHVGG